MVKVRLNATRKHNVVTYTVEVAFDNANSRVLPYLTADAQIEVVGEIIAPTPREPSIGRSVAQRRVVVGLSIAQGVRKFRRYAAPGPSTDPSSFFATSGLEHQHAIRRHLARRHPFASAAASVALGRISRKFRV